MELQGTIKKIFDTQTFQSGFQKREMILLTQEQYPQPISLEFLSEKAMLLDSLSEGDEVKVSINIRGREWTNPQGEVKYFNSIVGWRIEKATQNPSHNHEPVAATPSSNQQSTSAQENPFADDGDDDLPF